MWLPEGWWIITEKSTGGVRFTAGAKGLPEIESSAKFRSDRDATGVARKALRSMAYENQDSGWSKFRCHARLPGQLEHREDGFAITVGLMEYISGWSALEILYWLHEKQAIPTRVSGAVFRVRLTSWLCDFWRLHHETLSKHVDR